MDQQSQLTETTADGSHSSSTIPNAPASASANDRSGGQVATSNRGAEPQIFRDGSFDEWIQERKKRGESFGFIHVYLIAQRDLSGVHKRLAYNEKIHHSDDESGKLSNMVGHGGTTRDLALDLIIDWKLKKLANPYHESTRTIPSDNLRIFVADAALRHLSYQQDTLTNIVDSLNSLEENSGNGEIDLYERAHHLHLALHHGRGPLESRKRAIERTIRSKLDFSNRHGVRIPDPDPKFAEYDIGELKSLLEDARENIAQAEAELDDLRSKLQDKRDAWMQAQKNTLLPVTE